MLIRKVNVYSYVQNLKIHVFAFIYCEFAGMCLEEQQWRESQELRVFREALAAHRVPPDAFRRRMQYKRDPYAK
jgi:hypothetical protein